jgi:dihydropteroate synthase-like protein
MSTIQSIHFVTGKLAEASLREVVSALADKLAFNYTIDVLPITVAALMTPKWLLRHLSIPNESTRVILPGYLELGIDEVRNMIHLAYPNRNLIVECGPKDVRDLPKMFGKKRHRGEDYGQHSIEIIAEINHAPRLSLEDLIAQAKRLKNDGADRIDIGCDPSSRWNSIADAIKALRDQDLGLSIDTFDLWEAEQATSAGASLVLSVNETNRHAAQDWGAEVVVVPDMGGDFIKSLESTVELLIAQSVPFRLDPILEPIGCGFANSMERYCQTRRMFPDIPMMMGIGNITELTDADSAAINVVLLGFCEELQIGSILTTEVISWAQTAVRECDLARKLVNYAVRHRIPPKHLEERLVLLRDPSNPYLSDSAIQHLAMQLKDNNYRVLVGKSEIHLLSANVHIRGTDPYEMMQSLMALPESKNVDPSHAFYLGIELQKALTALTLGKRYEQDEALNWGFLTRSEKHHRLARARSSQR